MILVLSFDIYEQGTDPVIDWLLYLKAPFLKISINDLLKKEYQYTLNFEGNTISVNGEIINDLVNIIWYRRFYYDFELNKNVQSKFYNKLNSEVLSELDTLTTFLVKVFKDKKWMPSFEGHRLNKLEELAIARRVGLNVPKSIITNNKKDLTTFFETCTNGIITKATGNKSFYVDGENTYFAFTKAIDKETINNLDDSFFPSFFQEKIQSEFEIRIFALENDFYATAIICSDKLNEIDRKIYYQSDKTHSVPFNLPMEFQQLLTKFMNLSNLNTGCFDILKCTNGLYYFLEVNPVGQYSAPSMRCNFSLDKKIAEWLIKSNENG